MPFSERNQLRNHFVLGFVPFGGYFDDFIKPFIAEMKQLKEGKIMDIQGNKSFVIASIRDITVDLPQGNDMAGVKRHGATRGCRTCNATKDSWTANNLDLLLISRYKHLMDKQFEEISAAPMITRRKEITTERLRDVSPKKHFTEETFHQSHFTESSISPKVHFAEVISLKGHFAEAILPKRCFAEGPFR
ncbi:hypothetical protein C1646_766186 [Rhizophagus diaphanus]|nr:hypothetical protein C1646_766186 [Rhizophagus diaphanus] [Rhizophagus sp. MUCL 43196]